MVFAVSSSFMLNILLAATLQRLFGMINVLQIIVFHTLISIEFPQNVMVVNQVIIQILNVDLLDPSHVHHFIGLDFTAEYDLADNINTQHILTNQFKEMGFETLNPMLNLGGIFVLHLLYFLQLIIVPLLRKLIKIVI